MQNVLRDLLEHKLVRRARHPTLDLSIYNYTERTQFKNLWTDESKMCRGLVVNDDGVIVARPFRKFFNLSQVKYHNAHARFDSGEPYKVYDKLDGSLGIFFHYNSEWIMASRGSFTSGQAMKGMEILRNLTSGNFEQFDPKYTYVFEIIYPENRIVVDYGQMEKVVLLGVILTTSDLYEELDLEEAAKRIGNNLEYATNYSENVAIQSLEDLLKVEHKNQEGFVVRFESGERVKIKFADYVELHRIQTGFKFSSIYDALGQGKRIIDIVEQIPDEYHSVAKELETQALLDYDQINNDMKTIALKYIKRRLEGETMKEIAAECKKTFGDNEAELRIPKPFSNGTLMKSIVQGKFEPTETDRLRIFEYLKERCTRVSENKNKQWDTIPARKQNPYLLIMVGPSASGKSTFVKEYLQTEKEQTIVVSRDHIRQMFKDANKHHDHNQEMLVSELFNAMISTLSKRKVNIIIDNTNLRQSYINAIVQLTGYEDVRFQVMNADFMTCFTRNSNRPNEGIGAKVPTDVLKRQFKDMGELQMSDYKSREYNRKIAKIDKIDDAIEDELPAAYIFDLDGTLALHHQLMDTSIRHRKPHEYRKVDQDVLNIRVAEVMHKLAKTNPIIVVTGRPDSCETESLRWLKEKANIVPAEIHCRKTGDPRKDYIVKAEIWQDIENRFKIKAMFDDRNQVVEHARSCGYTVFQVDDGNF